MNKKLGAVFAAALSLFTIITAEAPAQSRPNPLLGRLAYNLAKAQANPEGELKAAIDVLEKELAEATRAGRTGEVRRLYAKGIALLQKKEWNDAADFAASLVLRAEETCLDSSRPFTIRIEQIYSPRLRPSGSLAARVSLRKPDLAPFATEREKIKDLAVREDLGRDLLDQPGRIELDLSGIEDGRYVIRADILDEETLLGPASIFVDLRRGLSERLAALESGLKKTAGFDIRRADVLYPLERIRNINRGRIEMGSFKVDAELKAAEGILASLQAGRDPYAGRTGDMERHYRLEGADEILPYRVFVPSRYDGRTAYPLIIALHGLGGDQGNFSEGYGKRLPALAEERGYIVAAPLGYRSDGFYGFNSAGFGGGGSLDAAAQRKLDYSERDVLNVLDLMKKDYRIDPSRIYLLGHSMGAIGTWHLGAKYPDIWAALAPFSGIGLPGTVAAMKAIPEFVVHGDADLTVPVSGSRMMVAELKRLGVEHRYIEVPGGNHINVVEPNLGAAVDFFDAHRKKAP